MEYIDHIYFHNPWYTEDIPSVVYQTKNGRVTGFLGVLPFQMVYKGRSVTAAIGGNYMVDPDAHDPFAGVLLLKKLFTGPQDLTMSDTGNDIGRRRWEEMGATTSDLHSLHWIRVLRPARFLVALGVNPKLKTLETLIRPLCTAADAVVT